MRMGKHAKLSPHERKFVCKQVWLFEPIIQLVHQTNVYDQISVASEQIYLLLLSLGDA